MPTPKKQDIWQQQQTQYTVPCSLFWIDHGYKDRDSIVLRFNDDGTVYLCDDRETRPMGEDKILSATVPFDLFAAEWPRFVEFLRARAAEKEDD